ncbi:MAG: D-alanyl-D-alanine carboxypeptidase/D-alanyl-D-alanine-endopeptidase [Bdellovibrionaceae bacterium]|jgi:serine-type D-Ala-D-Ala carboxypeptidase/endopeptidase (penicillin-binding protein 4)|nr:D-alanyl-D-alanine carboxypeptidase/D-alanyl-D-alanine-endopeptidase [Pseudobdellovibrionaceae bacterium]
MRFKIQYIILVLAVTVSLAMEAKDSLNTLSHQIKSKVLKSSISSSNLGILIRYDLGPDSKVLYQLNEKKKFIPASVSKIIPATVALEAFPRGHQFVTKILANKDVSITKTLNGSIYIKGDGDPKFTSESMWELVNRFSRTGITKITGDIIVDDSKFDQLRFDPSREASRIDRAYDAPVGALSFNWNSVNMFVRPGKGVGTAAIVTADPINEYVKVINQAKTVKAHKKTRLRVTRKNNTKFKKDTIVVTGTIALGHSEIVKYKNISYPDYWSGYQLKAFLKQRGIKVSGHVTKGKAPKATILLAQLPSANISLIVSDMMKYSNNYIAEMLTKNLAALGQKTNVSLKQGVSKMSLYLRNRIGLENSPFVFKNPSGLTRENRFSPEDIDLIHSSVQKNFQIFPEYLNSLPISGIDGSLKNRMKNFNIKGWVRAKTGTLTGVTALAGFAGQSGGTMFQFVYFFNGPERKKQKAMKLFDELSKTLVQGH